MFSPSGRNATQINLISPIYLFLSIFDFIALTRFNTGLLPGKVNAMNSFSELAKKWPSSIVSRSEIPTFTGGAVAVGTIANADSRGDGPKGRFKVGSKTCYTVESVIEWLESRTRICKAREISITTKAKS
jgi:hypothetical protein